MNSLQSIDTFVNFERVKLPNRHTQKASARRGGRVNMRNVLLLLSALSILKCELSEEQNSILPFLLKHHLRAARV